MEETKAIEEVSTPTETDMSEEDIWGEDSTPETDYEETEETEEAADTEGTEETETEDIAPAETYKIKVLGKEKEMTLEELIASAQKGEDYDRIKGVNDELAEFIPALGIFKELAEKNGMSVTEYISKVNENLQAQKIRTRAEEIIEEDGLDEETAERIARLELEKEEKQTEEVIPDPEADFDREYSELLRKANISAIPDDIAEKMNAYIADGLSLSESYYAAKADIATEQQRNAEQLNKNRNNTTGSARGRGKVAADENIAALMNG